MGTSINGAPVGGPSGGLPASSIGDLLSGAAASQFVATDAGGASVGLTAAQAQIALGLVAQPALNTGSVTNVGAGVGTLGATSFAVALPSGSAINDGSSTTIAWPSTVPLTFEMVFRAVFTGTSSGDRVARVYVNLGGSMAGHYFYVELDGNGNSTAKYDGSGVLGGGAISPLPTRTTTWIRIVMNGNRVAVWASNTSVFGSAYVDNYSVLPSFGVTSSGYFSADTIKLEGVNVNASTNAATSVTIDNLTLRSL